MLNASDENRNFTEIPSVPRKCGASRLLSMLLSDSAVFELEEDQLANLSNDSSEIRMRALQQIETRFVRGLRLGKTVNFKPLVLLKQLIRWFGSKPLLATDRVLTLLLELVHSEYGDVVVRKITYDRLCTELQKVMDILYCLDDKQAISLLENLQSLLVKKYKAYTDPSESRRTCDFPSNSRNNRLGLHLSAEVSREDYECAWTCASLDDIATMKSFIDVLGNRDASEAELQMHLTNLQIKMIDYPAEFFLQAPEIFLQLLQIQKKGDTVTTLLHANRALLTYVRQLQQRILIRQNVLSNVAVRNLSKTHPMQLRIPVAIGLLLNNCLEIMAPLLFSPCGHNWHLLELVVESIRTFDILCDPVGQSVTEKLGLMVRQLISYCYDSKNTDMSQLEENLLMPRLRSVVLSGILQNTVTLNLKHSKEVDRQKARALIQPIVTDSLYMYCVPDQTKSLNILMKSLCNQAALMEQKVLQLKSSYSLALSQLQDSTKLTGSLLVQVQRQICCVITQMGSETLVKQLFDSIIECTPLLGSDVPLRKEAEWLFSTLLDLPDEHLQSVVFRLMIRPVVDHFHALVNKSDYLPGCDNLELVRQHILGLPLNSMLLRKLLFYSWSPKAPQHVRQPCIDFLTMLLKLYSVLDELDFQKVCHLIVPALPLMVCRSVSQEQLHQVLWHTFEPDTTCFETLHMVRGNLCYMFHPDPQLRKDATARIVFTLQSQNSMHIYKPTIINLSQEIFAQDLCLVQPPLPYQTIFTESMVKPFERNRSVNALLRLLQTTDLPLSIRRSTLLLINVLLQNWETIDDFTKHEALYRQVLDALHMPLMKGYLADPLETLLPAISIFLKLLCHSADFRREMSYSFEVYVCLLRVIFILSHETELRREVSVCLFVMLFHEHITTNQITMVLDVDLGDLLVPIICELNTPMPLTPADDGLALEKELIDDYFAGNTNVAAQHWRFHLAHHICKTPSNRTLILIQNLDIRDALKLKKEDLALLSVCQVDAQIHRQLFKASNCTDCHSLKEIVARLQSFLVLLRSAVVKHDFTNMWSLIHKYIILVPGKSTDRHLYELILELCLSCLRFRNIDVLNGLTESLNGDPSHTFMMLLNDRGIELRLLQLICQCLIHMVEALHNQKVALPSHKLQYFYSKCFKELSVLASQHFELRQLEHVRCLLGVLRSFSDHPLNKSMTEVKYYAQHFVQLSSDLRTLSQTGSQLQRDCLHILAQIQTYNLPLEKVIRYLLSLCGHCNGEVRALAWVSLANCISNGIGQDIVSILPHMDFLPGGLPACCLTTMLDVHELMLVRTLAGRVFTELIPHIGPDAAIDLLNMHEFFKDAFLDLKCLKIDSFATLTDDLDSQRSCCEEVISCYIAICSSIVKRLPTWASILCDHAFINALYGVFKMLPTPPKKLSRPLMELCSVYISELYCMMNKDNFWFLQRTVCRDLTFLEYYLRLFNEVLDIEDPSRMLVHLLKLFLVMSKDDYACLFLFEQLKKQQSLLLDIFYYGLHLSHNTSPLQRYTLSVISVVLIKVQAVSAHTNLITELENYVLPLDELLLTDDEELQITAPVFIVNKENNINALNHKMRASRSQQKIKARQESEVRKGVIGVNFTNSVALLYYRLDRLFEHFFPIQTYNFLNPPGMGHVQVCEAMGGLLKLSPWAVHAAKQLKLQDRVFRLLENFLNDRNIGNAHVFVRRVGAHKCKNILSNLLMVLNMLAKWYSSIYAVITEPAVAVNAVRLLIRIWPWLSHLSLLKELTVQLAMFLTEHSFEMCKHTSLVLPGQSHSLLQLIVRVADCETTRRETLQKDDSTTPNPTLRTALRVMMNCCSCSDGRSALAKINVLDVFDTILPAIHSPNVAKIRRHVLVSWLSFWECYSRYDAGAKPCHLHGLVNAVRCLPPLHPLRLLCLRIFRNMCFLNGNRAHFVNFTQFLDLLRDVIAEPIDIGEEGDIRVSDLYEEQRIIVLILWKLFGFGAKYKAMLRETTMLKYLKVLRERLDNIKIKHPGKFQQLKHAGSLSDLLRNLFESLQ